MRERMLAERPFEIRTTDPIEANPAHPAPRAARAAAVDAGGRRRLADDPALHAYLLAYVSDYTFMSTALAPHGSSWLSPALQLASIDHVMWFHRPFRCDEWLLHVIDSPNARGRPGPRARVGVHPRRSPGRFDGAGGVDPPAPVTARFQATASRRTPSSS